VKLRAVALLLLVATFSSATRQSSARVPPHEEARHAIQHGDFVRALAIVDRALARPVPPESRELLFIAKADSLVQLHKPSEAYTVLESMPMPVTAEGRVRRLLSLGYTLTRLGKNEAANVEYRKAADLASRVAPKLRPEVLLNWAAPLFRMKRYTRATEVLHEAMAAAERLHQPYVLANAYGMLAVTEINQNRFEPAMRHSEIALRFAREAEAHHTLQAITGNLGWAYFQLGDFDEAIRRFEVAEADAQRTRLLRLLPLWQANITGVRISRRELPQALTKAEQSLATSRELNDDELIVASLANLAQVHIELRRYDIARQLNDEALRRDPEAPSPLINRARLDHAGGKSSSALATLTKLATKPDQDMRVKWQAQAIAASIYTDLRYPDDARRMYEAALDSGDEARAKVAAEAYLFAFETNLIRFYDAYINLLLSSKKVADALRVAERSRARTLRDGLDMEVSPNLNATTLARAHNATILCYWFGDERSWLWVVSSERIELVQLPPRKILEEAIDAYRREIIDRSHGVDSARGQRLYELLVAPAMPFVKSQRIVVIPDGRLNSMALDAVVVPSPARHYWVQDVTLSYSPALHFLQPSKARESAPQRLLLVGNVPAAPDFPALKRAGNEIDLVASHFKQPVVLAGARATPKAYLASSPARFNAIHFAAHGTANERAPLDSAVILAGDRLSGHQIKDVDLTAQLVTVSSCNSAGKRSYQGEGLVGLAWAFLRAGAKRVVAAQWEVSDATSPTLMNVMYREVAEGRDPAMALREAKLAMLATKTKDARPYNWAPFILYGAP
jgi:CHAT domain-containing protein/Tfp pilus assembly protein PilF